MKRRCEGETRVQARGFTGATGGRRGQGRWRMSDRFPDAGQPEPRLDFEVGELVAALRSYGVLTRDALLESSGASRWPAHNFEDALRRGVDGGSIKSLGEEFFEVADDAPEPERWKLAERKFPPP
jgi:hypothetical protein